VAKWWAPDNRWIYLHIAQHLPVLHLFGNSTTGIAAVPELKIGIQTASLRQPFKKALHTAARLGARGVEIDIRSELPRAELSGTAIRHIRKTLSDLNLTVCAVRFPTRRGYNVLDDLDRRVAATKDAMKLSFELGCRVLVNQVGLIPAQAEGPEWDLLVSSLSELGKYGQHMGTLLAAETGSECGTDMARLIEHLPAGSIGVTLDPGNLIINDFSPVTAIEALGEHIRYVHAKDGVRDLAQGRGIEVQLGRGSADFPLLLGMLEEREYGGYFTIERESPSNPVEEVAIAIEYLNRL